MRALTLVVATACSFDPRALSGPDAASGAGDAPEAADARPDGPPDAPWFDAVWPENLCWNNAGFDLAYGGHKYRFGANHRGFDNARLDECNAAQAYLVRVDDAGENDFLNGLTSSEDPWIGLRRDGDGLLTFHWVRDGGSGPPLGAGDYQNWDGGEPNNQFGDEDCVHFWGNDGTWNDEACSDARAYVCECERFRPPM